MVVPVCAASIPFDEDRPLKNGRVFKKKKKSARNPLHKASRPGTKLACLFLPGPLINGAVATAERPLSRNAGGSTSAPAAKCSPHRCHLALYRRLLKRFRSFRRGKYPPARVGEHVKIAGIFFPRYQNPGKAGAPNRHGTGADELLFLGDWHHTAQKRRWANVASKS